MPSTNHAPDDVIADEMLRRSGFGVCDVIAPEDAAAILLEGYNPDTLVPSWNYVSANYDLIKYQFDWTYCTMSLFTISGTIWGSLEDVWFIRHLCSVVTDGDLWISLDELALGIFYLVQSYQPDGKGQCVWCYLVVVIRFSQSSNSILALQTFADTTIWTTHRFFGTYIRLFSSAAPIPLIFIYVIILTYVQQLFSFYVFYVLLICFIEFIVPSTAFLCL